MSNQTKSFMSKDNIQVIVGIFSNYMKETHSVSLDMANLKKTIFSLMNTIMEATPLGLKSIHQMNLEVLTMAKAHYLKNSKTEKPNIMNLARETEVYGKRQVSINEMIPQRDPYERKAASDLDKIIAERDGPFRKVIPDITQLGRQITETAEGTDDFMLKLKKLEEERNEQQRMAVDKEFREANTIETVDPTALYKTQPPPVQQDINLSDIISTRQDFLISDPVKPSSNTVESVTIQKYLSVNSMDRQWTDNTLRYSYSVAFNATRGITGNYKNIRAIGVGKVVIPQEIIEHNSVLNLANKTQFDHEFSFSYPYLILRIDEFNDVYDGTNDEIRKSFCKLLYHRSYKAPNGRGYVILKPLQKEKKYFHPTPLSSLSRLSISLLKPNGFLLNQSADNYKVKKIYYSTFNPHMYEVMTDVFFDRNEFFTGDTVFFKDFTITSKRDQDNKPQPTIFANNVNAHKLNEFINRPEGHEIIRIGTPNENGFYRSFMIMAEGHFDRLTGKQDTNQDIVTVLNSYNDTIDYSTFTGFNGYIMNMSLQNTIGITLDVVVKEVVS